MEPTGGFAPLVKKERTKKIPGDKILETHRQVIQAADEKNENLVESATKKPRQGRLLQRKKVGRQAKQSRRLSLKERTGFKPDDRNLELRLVIEGDLPIL